MINFRTDPQYAASLSNVPLPFCSYRGLSMSTDPTVSCISLCQGLSVSMLAPFPSTSANRPVSTVTLQSRITWRRRTSESLPISERDLSVMSDRWHAWFTCLHADHDIISAERSKRSDPDHINGIWCINWCMILCRLPCLENTGWILYSPQDLEGGQDKLYLMGEESATGWLIS